MGRIARWGAGIVLVLLVGSALLPAETKESVGESWRRVTKDSGQACFDWERQKFKDPYSAKFDSYAVRADDANIVVVRYHAKNSFGAYIPGEAVCLVRSGIVDEPATEQVRLSAELDKSIAKLKARNECLRGVVELMRSGKPGAAEKIRCPEAE